MLDTALLSGLFQSVQKDAQPLLILLLDFISRPTPRYRWEVTILPKCILQISYNAIFSALVARKFFAFSRALRVG